MCIPRRRVDFHSPRLAHTRERSHTDLFVVTAATKRSTFRRPTIRRKGSLPTGENTHLVPLIWRGVEEGNVTKRRWLTAAWITGLTASALIIIWWRADAARTGRPGLAAFVAAASALDVRPLDVRPTGGFAYRPLRPPKRGKAPSAVDLPWQLLAAAANLQEAAKKRGVDDLQAAGVSYLVLGSPGNAVETLEQALSAESKRTDIGAAI
jgi:hypothetical protein